MTAGAFKHVEVGAEGVNEVAFCAVGGTGERQHGVWAWNGAIGFNVGDEIGFLFCHGCWDAVDGLCLRAMRAQPRGGFILMH